MSRLWASIVDVSSYFAPGCPLSPWPPWMLSRDLGGAGPRVLSSASSISPGGDGVPGTRGRRGQRLTPCLGNVPVEATGEGASVWDQGDKDEPAQPSQAGAGCSGVQISASKESRREPPSGTSGETHPATCLLLLSFETESHVAKDSLGLTIQAKMTLNF